MSELKYSDNRKEFIRAMNNAGMAVQEAGAMAINSVASVTAGRYKKALQSGRIKLRAPRYTLGAVRIFPAHAKHSKSGEYRKMSDINSIVGVLSRGAKGEHYLAIMEVGGVKRGSRMAGNRVSVPLLSARGGNEMSPVKKSSRLNEGVNQYQKQLRVAQNPRQQYAIFRALAKKGLANGLYQTDEAIFRVSGRKVQKVRTADKTAIRVKAIPLFGESVDKVSPSMIDKYFKYFCKKLLGDIGK
jgi:hypothetical protein